MVINWKKTNNMHCKSLIMKPALLSFSCQTTLSAHWRFFLACKPVFHEEGTKQHIQLIPGKFLHHVLRLSPTGDIPRTM